MKKTLSIIAVVILAVIVGAGLYLYLSFGSLVRSGVETYGPRFTQTRVALGSVDASLIGGEITVNEFVVGNPQGYSTPHAFKVARVHVAVDRSSLAGDVIRIREIVIEGPDIIYELGPGGSNLEVIQRNVARASGDGPGAAPPEKAPAEKAGEGPRVVIDHLYVRDAKAALSADMLGGKVVPVPVPDLHLTDIGKKSDGATLADAAEQVMDAITASVTRAVEDIDIEGLKKRLEGVRRGAEEAIEGTKKGAEGALEGVTEELEGLFGK